MQLLQQLDWKNKSGTFLVYLIDTSDFTENEPMNSIKQTVPLIDLMRQLH